MGLQFDPILFSLLGRMLLCHHHLVLLDAQSRIDVKRFILAVLQAGLLMQWCKILQDHALHGDSRSIREKTGSLAALFDPETPDLYPKLHG